MEAEFIPYELALALKELGFDEPCFGFYNDMENNKPMGGNFPCDGRNSAPLCQQVFRFFREKHNLLGNIYSNASGWLWEIHDNIGGTHRFGSEWSGDCEESGMFTSYEKAELECLKKLIEIVKEKK